MRKFRDFDAISSEDSVVSRLLAEEKLRNKYLLRLKHVDKERLLIAYSRQKIVDLKYFAECRRKAVLPLQAWEILAIAEALVRGVVELSRVGIY